MNGHCVVWDCDGTVVDSEPIGTGAWAVVLARYGYTATPDDFARIIGRPFDVFYEYFLARTALPAPELLMAEYEEVLFPELRARLRVFPDALAAINSLVGARVPQAMASSSHRGRVDPDGSTTPLPGGGRSHRLLRDHSCGG